MRTNREEWRAWTCDVEDLVKEVRLVRAYTIPSGRFDEPAGGPPVPQTPPPCTCCQGAPCRYGADGHCPHCVSRKTP